MKQAAELKLIASIDKPASEAKTATGQQLAADGQQRVSGGDCTRLLIELRTVARSRALLTSRVRSSVRAGPPFYLNFVRSEETRVKQKEERAQGQEGSGRGGGGARNSKGAAGDRRAGRAPTERPSDGKKESKGASDNEASGVSGGAAEEEAADGVPKERRPSIDTAMGRKGAPASSPERRPSKGSPNPRRTSSNAAMGFAADDSFREEGALANGHPAPAPERATQSSHF
jgi:hypothetical protein